MIQSISPPPALLRRAFFKTFLFFLLPASFLVSCGPDDSVVAVDTSNLVITCPLEANVPVVLTIPPGANDIVLTDILSGVTAEDDSGISPTITYSQTIFTATDVGAPITVTATATDAAGNTNTCDFTVTVAIDTGLVITCPLLADVSVVLTIPSGEDDITLTDILSGVTAEDDSDISPTITYSQTIFTATDVGAPITVTATAMDTAGNTDTCDFPVTVAIDTAPVIACPMSADVPVVLTIPPGANDITLTDALSGVTVEDDSGISPTITYSQTLFGLTDVGEAITVTATATDAVENTATCDFSVLVVGSLSLTDCPTDQLDVVANAASNADPNADSNPIAEIQWNNPTGDITLTSIVIMSDDAIAPTVTADATSANLPVGTYTITINAESNTNAALTGACIFSVSVIPPLGTPTLMNCISPETGLISNQNDMTEVTWTIPTVVVRGNDQAAITLSVVIASESTGSGTPPSIPVNSVDMQSNAMFPIGVFTITYTATNTSANPGIVSIDPCVIIVMVNLVGLPTLACPMGASENLGASATVVASWSEPVYAGGANSLGAALTGPMTTATLNPPLVDGIHSGTFPLGTTSVTYTAVDTMFPSLSETCSFNVIISDVTDPTIVCPDYIEMDIIFGSDLLASVVLPAVVVATDNSGMMVAVEASVPDGSDAMITVVDVSIPNTGTGMFPLGETTIIYTAIDGSSNTMTCEFPLTITDPSVPLFSRNDLTLDPSATNPFLIEDSDDLRKLSEVVNENTTYILGSTTNNYNEADYFLMVDITLDSPPSGMSSNFTPIGLGTNVVTMTIPDQNGNTRPVTNLACDDNRCFRGTFDGNEKTIANLQYTGDNILNVGLFGVTGGSSDTDLAVIKDLTLTNSMITNNNIEENDSHTGALVGVSLANSLIANVSSSGTMDAGNQVGGLAGSNDGFVTTSYSSVTVTGDTNIGGLVGFNKGTITASAASGTVTGKLGAVIVGGLVGNNDVDGVITASVAFGTVTSSANFSVGGLVGVNDGTTIASFASGRVDSIRTTYVGGLAGATGLAGIISNSYARGTIRASRLFGGLVGGSANRTAGTGGITASYGLIDSRTLEGCNPFVFDAVPGICPADTGQTEAVLMDGSNMIYSTWNDEAIMIINSTGTAVSVSNPWDLTAGEYPAIDPDTVTDFPLTIACQRTRTGCP